MTVRESHAHRSDPRRGDNPSRAWTACARGCPHGFVVVMVRAPSLVAAMALAVVAQCIALLAMPINEEVPATRPRTPWLAVVLAFAVAIFVIAYVGRR